MPFDKPADRIEWLGHAGFRLRIARRTIYIDPYRASGGPAADLILITHDHFDHFSPEDLGAVMRDDTEVIAPATVTEQLEVRARSIAPGETIELAGLDVIAV